MFKLFLKE